MPRLRVSPCRREVRPPRATSGQHETEFLPSWVLGLWSWAFGLGPWLRFLADHGNRLWPPATDHWPPAGSSPNMGTRNPAHSGVCRPPCPPLSHVRELCVGRRSVPRDNSGIATACPASDYNAGRQFCGTPHNGLFYAHNVSHDAVTGCSDVFTTAKYARPGVVSEKHKSPIRQRTG